MTRSTGEFADLLTTAVRKIKAIEGRNLDIIQDELGFALGREGASYINYLRRNNKPGNLGELEALTWALVNRRGLSDQEIERFLRLGGHTDPLAVLTTLALPSGASSGASLNGVTAGSNGHPAQQAGAFVAGPPITKPHQFFGRERELRRIFGWWRQFPMSHIALVGPRRSGKTSLLHYLRRIHAAPPTSLRPNQKQDWLPNARSYRWVWIDFQDVRMRKLDTLLRHMLVELDLPLPTQSPCNLDFFMDIATEPQHWQRPTIIVMDDIGKGLDAPDFDQTLWDSLRALVSSATEGNLAFIVSAHDDPARLADAQSKTSRFFNIFNTVVLGPLTDGEARELMAEGAPTLPPHDANWIVQHSNCWPILVQTLGQEWQLAQEEGANVMGLSDAWRAEGLRRISPYRHLVQPPLDFVE